MERRAEPCRFDVKVRSTFSSNWKFTASHNLTRQTKLALPVHRYQHASDLGFPEHGQDVILQALQFVTLPQVCHKKTIHGPWIMPERWVVCRQRWSFWQDPWSFRLGGCDLRRQLGVFEFLGLGGCDNHGRALVCERVAVSVCRADAVCNSHNDQVNG